MQFLLPTHGVLTPPPLGCICRTRTISQKQEESLLSGSCSTGHKGRGNENRIWKAGGKAAGNWHLPSVSYIVLTVCFRIHECQSALYAINDDRVSDVTLTQSGWHFIAVAGVFRCEMQVVITYLTYLRKQCDLLKTQHFHVPRPLVMSENRVASLNATICELASLTFDSVVFVFGGCSPRHWLSQVLIIRLIGVA